MSLSPEFVGIGSAHGKFGVTTPWEALSSDRVDSKIHLTAQDWNHPEHIAKFLDRTSVYTLETTGTRLHFTQSDTPYSEDHIMIVLENEEMVKRPDWQKGLIIHDQDRNIKTLYWLGMLKTLDQYTKDFDKTKDILIFSENTCSRVTNESSRMPRSLGIIHGHITRFPIDQIRPYGDISQADIVKLREEADLWEYHAENFLTSLNNKLEAPKYQKRQTALPPGYSTIITRGNTDFDTAQKLGDILSQHHVVYSQTIPELTSNIPNHKPQPSYRTYVQIYDNNQLEVIISPIIVHHAGSITASGIFFDRIHNPSYPIVQRRREATHSIQRIGNDVVQDLIDHGLNPQILRNQYPY